MKVIGINASPRKGWNDDILMHKALEGAASESADTEAINASLNDREAALSLNLLPNQRR